MGYKVRGEMGESGVRVERGSEVGVRALRWLWLQGWGLLQGLPSSLPMQGTPSPKLGQHPIRPQAP